MKAQTRNITYWLKNIVGFGLIIAAIWLLAFFKESKAGNLHPFIRDYHNQIGFVLFPLGAVVVAGISNIARAIIGLIVIAIGTVAFAFFMPMRDTWAGQIITNFIAPAVILWGMLIMVLFDNDINSRRRR